MKILCVENITVEELLDMLKTVFKNDVNPEEKNQMNYKNVILTRKDAAKLLDVSYPTLNNWAKHRILIPRNIGNRVYYHMDDILKSMKPIYSSNHKS